MLQGSISTHTRSSFKNLLPTTSSPHHRYILSLNSIMNPTLSSFRNDPLPHERLSAYERPPKRPRQSSIALVRGQNASVPNELPTKHRKLADSRTLPLPSRSSMSQNRVTISSLLSMRPPGGPSFLEKPQLPRLSDAFLASVRAKNGTRAETLSRLALESNQKTDTNADATSYSQKELSSSTISMQHGMKQEAPTPRVVPKLPGPVVNAPSGAKRKVIPCPYEFCQKKFSRNSNLKVHMRIHTKTYPFACNLCEREFMWSSSLHWHTKWHEKVAMREAAKLKNGDGVGLGTSAATGNGQACTCNCVCPVHKTKPVSAGGNESDSQKLHTLKRQFDVPSSQ